MKEGNGFNLTGSQPCHQSQLVVATVDAGPGGFEHLGHARRRAQRRPRERDLQTEEESLTAGLAHESKRNTSPTPQAASRRRRRPRTRAKAMARARRRPRAAGFGRKARRCSEGRRAAARWRGGTRHSCAWAPSPQPSCATTSWPRAARSREHLRQIEPP